MQADLSQMEAEALLRMKKFRVDSTSHPFPDLGGHIQFALQSLKTSVNSSLLTSAGEELPWPPSIKHADGNQWCWHDWALIRRIETQMTQKLACHIYIFIVRAMATNGHMKSHQGC